YRRRLLRRCRCHDTHGRCACGQGLNQPAPAHAIFDVFGLRMLGHVSLPVARMSQRVRPEVAGPMTSEATSGIFCAQYETAASQTDLVAASNKIRKGMEATYPQRSTNVLTFRSVYSTSEANFHWQEWGVFNASSAGEMLSRKAEELGTKTSAATWQL